MDDDDSAPVARDWGWVFHTLTKGPASRRCKLPMPETILFKDSEPCRWVFTAKTGQVMSRSANKLKMAKIKRRFMDRHQICEDEDGDVPVCVRRKGVGMDVKVDIMTAADLIELCSDSTGASRGGMVALQDFVEAGRLTNLKCKYMKNDDMPKGFKFETSKVSEVSAQTSKILAREKQDSLEHVKSQMSDANQLVEGITWRIVRFVESNTPVTVLSMVADFVLDDENQAWFTHTSELITGPKPPKWHPPSGNEVKLAPNIEVRPQLVRKKPLKDGTPVCCGDYCFSKISEIIAPENDGASSPKGLDMSIFTNESKIEQIEKSTLIRDKSKPVVGVKSMLHKSIFLARMEKGGQKPLPIANETAHRAQLEQRMLPQIRPSAQAKHSLHDYYEMVPVCDNCFKVYCHFDRERLKSQCVVEIFEEPEDILKSSPLFGGGPPGVVVDGTDGSYDMSAKGIRQRLTDLYTAQAQPMCSLFQPKVVVESEEEFAEGTVEEPSGSLGGTTTLELNASGKRSVSVLGAGDYRLPDLAAQKGKPFPRSQSSMSFSSNTAKRGVVNSI